VWQQHATLETGMEYTRLGRVQRLHNKAQVEMHTGVEKGRSIVARVHVGSQSAISPNSHWKEHQHIASTSQGVSGLGAF
jgi:hypothetical protein